MKMFKKKIHSIFTRQYENRIIIIKKIVAETLPN